MTVALHTLLLHLSGTEQQGTAVLKQATDPNHNGGATSLPMKHHHLVIVLIGLEVLIPGQLRKMLAEQLQ